MTGFKVWTAERVDYDDFNDYLQEQVIPSFTSTAQRDSMWTAPTEDSLCKIMDGSPDRLQRYNGSAWAEWQDLGHRTSGAWTIDQGATTNIAKTISDVYWSYGGAWITAAVTLSVTAAGTAGSSIRVSLPVATVGNVGMVLGTARVLDTSVAPYICTVEIATSTTILFKNDASGAGSVGTAPSFALASGDVIAFNIRYPVSGLS
jgi:hypothetical protein